MGTANGLGIALSLATAVLWAISPMFMGSVARRIGSHPTNLLRLLIAGTFFIAVLLPLYLLLHRGAPLPTRQQCLWLILSGLVGILAGDACFYEALVLLGPRRAIKVSNVAPVFALGIGWAWQGEQLTHRALVGTSLVLAAVLYTAFRDARTKTAPVEPGRMSPMGLFFGIASALSIALGAVFARKAFLLAPTNDRPLDPIIGSIIRVGSAAAVFWLLPLFTGNVRQTLRHLAEPLIVKWMLIGVSCGAIGGMLLYVAALRYAPAGVVSTLISTSTLIIIPLTALRYRIRIGWDITTAACIAVIGVGLISWR